MRHMNIKIFDYSVDFLMKSNLLLLSGDSGIGKTVLYRYFYNISNSTDAIICIDTNVINIFAKKEKKEKSDVVFDLLKNNENKFIVIDNADSILDMKSRGFIGMDEHNEYLIFGRNVTGLFINKNRIAYLKRNDVKKTISLDYKYESLI
ncbi:MAG: AAA family ATPase [Lachnospiraceae bacterium]|nr:AAA family ATPase [Lachnospiraceae bacterium]